MAAMNLIEWASRWGISPAAINDLVHTCVHVGVSDGQPEAAVQQQTRLEAARAGKLLFRNNRGAGKMASGTFVRYGLANDSKALGDAVKSADLVGLESVLITPEHVGTIIARFLSVEVKASNWKFSGTLEECAQLQWASIINAKGGRAIITNHASAVLTDSSTVATVRAP